MPFKRLTLLLSTYRNYLFSRLSKFFGFKLYIRFFKLLKESYTNKLEVIKCKSKRNNTILNEISQFA